MDLIGKKFNRLTVISSCEDHELRHKFFWNCRCDCGNVRVIDGYKLNTGHTQSCGCLGQEKRQEACFKNLVGKIYGGIAVLSFAYFKKNSAHFNCRCYCGDIFIVKGTYLVNKNTRSCGCLQKLKAKENIKKAQLNTDKGEDHYRYRHDISNIEREKLSSKRHRCLLPENRIWRENVFKRDDYTCQISNVKGGKICAHHLYGFAENPLKRIDVDNGITISKELHTLFHKIYGKGNNTPLQFQEFKKYVQEVLK